ncbi:MAG: hypothetical protein K9I55_08725 [Haliscomenobacter sp.]|nr:hypothetical protein [Haliscomenobacter sp.]
MAWLCPVMEVNPVNRSFESGFTGFPGLIITSPIWVGRLLLKGVFISRSFADALRIGEKKGIK